MQSTPQDFIQNTAHSAGMLKSFQEPLQPK